MNKNKIPKSLVSLLLAEAAKVDTSTFALTMPLYVVLGEAVDVARFCKHHWKAEVDPKTEAIITPGLEQAGASLLPKQIGDEIIALQEEVQKAQTAYLLAIDRPSEGTARAEFVLDEIAAGLAWLCEDGEHDETAAKLAAVVEAHRGDPESEDALASELADYVGLAEEARDELAKIPSFELAIIEEGRGLVMKLRERSATRALGRGSEASELLKKRNQLTAVLLERMARVRAAARYVFRHHDEILRQVTSAYQRRRRAAARKRASQSAEGGASPPVVEPAGESTSSPPTV